MASVQTLRVWPIAILVLACTPDPEVSAIADAESAEFILAGQCGEVALGPWVRSEEAEPDSEPVSRVWTVRFDSLPPLFESGHLPEARLAHTRVEGAWHDFPFQRWWMSGD